VGNINPHKETKKVKTQNEKKELSKIIRVNLLKIYFINYLVLCSDKLSHQKYIYFNLLKKSKTSPISFQFVTEPFLISWQEKQYPINKNHSVGNDSAPTSNKSPGNYPEFPFRISASL